MVDRVEKTVPCVLALVVQVANTGQHLDDDLSKLNKSFLRDTAALVALSHLVQQLYNLLEATGLAQTVDGRGEDRPGMKRR
jgi:hypothetical protein